MVLENCMPLQHKAHIATGNTSEALAKCALAMFEKVGASRVFEWYRSLIEEHELSMNKGILVPSRDLKMYHLIKMMELGARLDGISMTKCGWDIVGEKGKFDLRAQIALRYQDRSRRWKERLPKKHNGFLTGELARWLHQGHCAEYLIRTLGIDTSYWA